MTERRAAAYTEALELLHRMIGAYPSTEESVEGLEKFRQLYDDEPPGDLGARISAFGSQEAAETFRRGYRNAYDAATGTDVLRDHQRHLDEGFPADVYGRLAKEQFAELHARYAGAREAHKTLSHLAARDLQRPAGP